MKQYDFEKKIHSRDWKKQFIDASYIVAIIQTWH